MKSNRKFINEITLYEYQYKFHSKLKLEKKRELLFVYMDKHRLMRVYEK